MSSVFSITLPVQIGQAGMIAFHMVRILIVTLLLCAAVGVAYGQTSADTDDSTLVAAHASILRDSTKVDEYFTIAAIYKARKQFLRELDLAERMFAANPSSPFSYFLLGDAQLDNSMVDSAITSLKRALIIQPNFVRARVTLAEAYTMIEEYDSAIAELDTALEHNPRYAQTHVQRAQLLTQLERHADAVENYRIAAELLPYSFESWYRFGQALLRAHAYEEAIIVFQYAISLNEGSSDALLAYADANAGAGRHDAAVIAYREFMLRFPIDSRALDAERRARDLGWRP